MAESKPLVSIIIPVYNGGNYMREAIGSALAQDYDRKEIIVVNDGSNDGGATEKIALSYGDQIRYIKKENGGVSSALNVGINAMSGDYFSWLSHDDVYLPQKLSSQVSVLRDEKSIVICGAKQIDCQSRVIPNSKKDTSQWSTLKDGEALDWREALMDLIKCGSFNGCALLIPKAAFSEVGFFDEDLRFLQDMLMWAKLFLAHYCLVKAPGVHVYGRMHAKQLTLTGEKLRHKDSIPMGDQLLEPFLACSTKEQNYIKEFTLFNAKHANNVIVEKYIRAGKEHGLLNRRDIALIRAVQQYGTFRPAIRKMYYKHVLGLKV